jgi:hypothetical protein
MPKPAKPKEVRVTIISHLPELKDKLKRLEQVKVDPSTTWLDLLRFNKIPVDIHKHQIKSSRNCACLDDQIQRTADHFQRGNLRVQINTSKRVRVSNLLKPKINDLPPHLEPQTSTSTARQAVQGSSKVTANAIVNGNRRSTSKLGPGTAAHGVRAGLQGGEELNISTGKGVGYQQRTPPVDPIVGGPTTFFLRENYAESQASQDSQPEDDDFTSAKRNLLERMSRLRNTDVVTILSEMKAIQALPGDSCFRWTRKAPFLSLVMIDWANREPDPPIN